jgi:uncharacterized membrane protein YbaN (DUF454 family)
MKSKNTGAILMLLAILLFTLLVHFMSVRRVEGFEEMMMKDEMMKEEMMKEEMMKEKKESVKMPSNEEFKKVLENAK